MDGKLIFYILIGLAYYAYQIYKQVQKKNETKPPQSNPLPATEYQPSKQVSPIFKTTPALSEAGLLGYEYHPEVDPQIENVTTTAYRPIQIETKKKPLDQTISMQANKTKPWFSGENTIRKAFINSIILEKKH